MDDSDNLSDPLAVIPAGGSDASALSVRGLEVEFDVEGSARSIAVRGLDIGLSEGRVLGVAGESGSGKSSLALAIMGLLPRGSAVRGSIEYKGIELIGKPEAVLRKFRGSQIAMVSQETGGALNPTLRIGQQMRLVLRAHFSLDKAEISARSRKALEDVQMRDVERVLHSYPTELSGGMCQRVVIAMALACGSRVLLADEPTTALDVTVQGEIIRLLRDLVNDRGLALMMISHDLAVLNEICDDLVVMYRGEAVEKGPIGRVLGAPAHPYTRGLLSSIPRMSNRGGELPVLPAAGAGRGAPDGCAFADRCRWRIDRCDEKPPLVPVEGSGAHRLARCHRAEEVLHDTSEAS
jgi:peptide/nickel transport system ATP-binding protein